VKQLARLVHRATLWALVVVVLASSLAVLPGALGASPNYTLTGYVKQPSGADVPSGVQVDLVSQASGAVYTTTTTSGGTFSFTNAGTSGALVPGYWGLWVPAQTNTTFGSGGTLCKPCAALSANQNPTYVFENATALTTSLYNPTLSNVQILFYNATLTGTVYSGGSPLPSAPVRLLAPLYNGVILSNTTSNATTGVYSLKAPYGTWVLQSSEPGPSPNYVNSTQVTIASRTPPAVNPNIQPYLVSGTVLQPSLSPVPSSGNATLFDPANGDLFSRATPPGGFYQLGTYPSNFVSGSHTVDVFLSTVGYAMTWYPLTVSGPTAVQRNVVVPTVLPSQLGNYLTTLDLSGFNVNAGTGSLYVNTTAALGNNTVLPGLPNATVGQLWTQLGLDFAHAAAFPETSISSVYAWANASGPFFPAVQAGASINGTGFLGPSAPQTLSGESSGCSGSCDASSAATLTLDWSNAYALNGTLFKNSSTYTLSFGFKHPVSADVYNYTVDLPSGYVLKADTPAPSNTRLIADGSGGTWTKFSLLSLPSPTAGGTFSFSIVRYAALTAIVNASVTNFAFSSHNVLNQTNGNYTVLVGVGQNVTFSALNSIYPSGTNGTKFVWAFGDGGHATNTTGTVYHTYTTASGATPDTGTLTVTSSGGLVNSTTFHVWVGSGPVTAGIAWNATTAENRSVGGTTYVFVNWSTVLHFNATASVAQISPTAPIPGNISVASYSLSAWKGFTTTIANYSVAQGSSFLAFQNASYQFLGAGAYLSSGRVGSNAVAFLGWQYNLTLTVWSSTGQTASTTLVILVNDTEAPVSAFQLLNPSGKVISGTGIIAGSNASARVLLNGGNASDPHNGSVSKYYWLVTNSADSKVHFGINTTAVKPYPSIWLLANSTAYTVNLTVWDLNGNHGYATQTLTVSVNTTLTPIMAANNLTGPTKLTAGTEYTFWVNVTTGGGPKSVATNVQVAWYTTPPGSSSRNYIANTPHSVKFYNYTSPGVPNTVAQATGTLPSLAYNTTVRAVISWTPVITGNYVLYANATASNQFSGNSNLPGVISMSITINQNPNTLYLEYGVIAAVAVVVILGLIFWVRRRGRVSSGKSTTGRRGLERGKRSDDQDEDEDDDKS
jgi:hypothetical protein